MARSRESNRALALIMGFTLAPSYLVLVFVLVALWRLGLDGRRCKRGRRR